MYIIFEKANQHQLKTSKNKLEDPSGQQIISVRKPNHTDPNGCIFD